jgi:probable F420-dependent oxidoreductase
MLVDVRLDGALATAGSEASAVERSGFDAAWVAEAGNDPFLAIALAAEHTSHIQLGTAVAIAFARSPMTVAQTAWQLNNESDGRFLLGLGSQVKAHIERRYSMPWSRPAARMREFVLALHAIWSSWSTGEPLAFSGEFYTHTLMSPMFAPAPNPVGAPRVFIAAVGPLMTEAAGEVADGLRVHGFTTERHLREVSLPAIDRGLAKSGRGRDAFEISYPVMYATGHDDEEIDAAVLATRRQLAFYGSTPAYRSVLDLHGWGDLQPDLYALARQGEWTQMGALIDDEVLDAFAVVGTVPEVARQVLTRYGDVVDRISLHQPYGSRPEVDLVGPVKDELRKLSIDAAGSSTKNGEAEDHSLS